MKKGLRWTNQSIKTHSPEKMEVVEGKYMKDIVDKYLEETFKDEAKAVGKSALVMIAGIIILYMNEIYKDKRTEKIMKKNKDLIEKILKTKLSPLIDKIFRGGTTLHKLLFGRYKHIMKFWPEIKEVQNLKNKKMYTDPTLSSIDEVIRGKIRNKKADFIRFFSYKMGIGPSGDSLMDNVGAAIKYFRWDKYPIEDWQSNPIYMKWHHDLHKVLDEIKEYEALEDFVINTFVDELLVDIKKKVVHEGIVHEAGFEEKPKGWTDQSIKKYSNTFSKKMKGGVKTKGFFDKCVKKMQGKMENPEGFCAALKDEAYGSTHWRGKDKSPSEVNKDVKKHQNVKE